LIIRAGSLSTLLDGPRKTETGERENDSEGEKVLKEETKESKLEL
jgi:hypothetical protein